MAPVRICGTRTGAGEAANLLNGFRDKGRGSQDTPVSPAPVAGQYQSTAFDPLKKSPGFGEPGQGLHVEKETYDHLFSGTL